MANRRHITLRELAGAVRDAIEAMDADQWVVAELSQVNVNRQSGHCYLELVEKDGERVAAQMRANIWKGPYLRIAGMFRAATGADLAKGMKVLMKGSLTYHEVFGLAFNITDIDPAYTLGEMAMKRRETLERLRKECLLDLNRQRPMPMVPQRIAVISSETAAGYGDFKHRIHGNPYGYAYTVTLFPAYMQGDQAERSIIAAMRACVKRAAEFDLVVIIRGGGSQVELSCFDGYDLSAEVARCQLPVLTGIGHERDETVVDSVAARRLITPSAVAEFIVNMARAFEDRVEAAAASMVSSAREGLEEERHALLMLSHRAAVSVRERMGHGVRALAELAAGVRHGAGRGLREARMRLDALMRTVSASAAHACRPEAEHIAAITGRIGRAALYRQSERARQLDAYGRALALGPVRIVSAGAKRLDLLDAKVRLLDPLNVLRRGYSITYSGGASVRDASMLAPGSVITTRFHAGSSESVVRRVSKEAIDGEEGPDV